MLKMFSPPPTDVLAPFIVSQCVLDHATRQPSSRTSAPMPGRWANEWWGDGDPQAQHFRNFFATRARTMPILAAAPKFHQAVGFA